MPSSDKTVGSIKEKWPADKVERVSIDKLIPYARNARTHSDAQVAQIAASIKEWGWTSPVLVDETGQIIAGHGRVMAARQLGLKEVPVMTATGWTEAQKKAYVLADNQLAMNAGWDNDLLSVEIKDLAGMDFNLDLIGFDGKVLEGLLADKTEGLTDPDEVPEAPENPVSKLGDLWVLGKHRIICGDSTDVNNWDKLKISDGFLCFTSPPYNLGKSAKLSGNKSISKKGVAYDNYEDQASSSEYIDLINGSLSLSLLYCDASVFNVQPLAGSKRELFSIFNINISRLVDIITWDKGHAAPPMAAGVLSSRYEWMVIFSKKENASRSLPLSNWKGKHSNVYTAPPQRNNEFSSIHGATFPVHLPEYVIGDLMNRSRGVVDCFMGTGTTLIAAEKLNRECCGIELSPSYVDVIIKRWQDFTGQEAILDGDGRTFNEMKNERQGKEG